MPLFWKVIFAIQALLVVNLVSAAKTSRSNVAIYWGQGPNQKNLLHYCKQSAIDTVILSFIHIFPDQGNGYPGSSFGNQCSGSVYRGPGNDPSGDQLQSSCPYINADIPVCQKQYGKKILLSLGGGTSTYQLTGEQNGKAFAEFLWGAFGPQKSKWISDRKPRPFDGPNNEAVEVDGFDFDVEFTSNDNSVGYIAMINRLRSLFAETTKSYLITGAPQCVFPDANMGAMISAAKFDILYIQFYNTPQCSARSWWDANPKYSRTRKENPSGLSISYAQWTSFIENTASKDAKIYIGLPGSTRAVFDPSFYVPSSIVPKLLSAYFCKSNFGGVAIWEATYADENRVGNGSGNFYQYVKKALKDLDSDVHSGCYEK